MKTPILHGVPDRFRFCLRSLVCLTIEDNKTVELVISQHGVIPTRQAAPILAQLIARAPTQPSLAHFPPTAAATNPLSISNVLAIPSRISLTACPASSNRLNGSRGTAHDASPAP